MEVVVTARKWGNSIGVTLPREVVEKQGIRDNEKFVIDVQRGKPAKVSDIFGLAKGWKIDTQKVKDKQREEDLERDRNLCGLIRHH